MAYCSGCGVALAPGTVACAQCGQAVPYAGAETGQWASPQAQPPSYSGAPPPAYAPYPVPYDPNLKAPPTQGVAVVALMLNILIWPGLGSLIGGRSVGWGQGFLFLGGVILAFVLIGIPLLIGAWIWGIVTGVELINEAAAANR